MDGKYVVSIYGQVAQLGEPETDKRPVDACPGERLAMEGEAGVQVYPRSAATDGMYMVQQWPGSSVGRAAD